MLGDILKPGNHVKFGAPVAVKVVLEPLHIKVLMGVMDKVKVGDTLILATALTVQAPVPDITV